MQRWRAAGLAWMLGAAALLAAEQPQPRPAPLLPIEQAIRAQDYAGALRLCRQALARTPNDVRLWTLRGMAAGGAGQPRQALEFYQHALHLLPGYLPALAGAAQSEFQLGESGARALLEQVLAQRPADPATHLLLGILDFREQRCAPAIAHFEQASPVLAHQPVALSEYGQCLASQQRMEAAAAAFAQALALDPAKPEARYNLALAQWNLHRADDALATLEPLCRATPADGDALELSAEIDEEKGDTASAIQLLRQAILADPRRVSAYLVFATLSYDHASPQVGIDIVNAGLTQLPAEPRLYLVRGILLTQFGEFTRAADDFETARHLDPHLGFLGVAQGLILSQQHNAPEALARFRAAVKEHPGGAYGYNLLAEALQELGKPEGSPEYEEELQAATRAVQLDPKLAAAQDLLTTILLEAGHTEEAIAHSRAALAIDPDDQQAVYHLVVALRKSDPNHELPGLLKRLVELRSRAKGDEPHARKYRLYEAPAEPGR
jgi:tetratricopeptide (TPR) repeat protein